MKAFAASRVLAGIVYEATASDPLVVLGVIAIMAGIGLVSAAWPARRAFSKAGNAVARRVKQNQASLCIPKGQASG